MLQPNLSAASHAMRAATLRVLCCYNAPFAPAPIANASGPPAPPAPSDVLPLLLQIESQTCSTENGRRVRPAHSKMPSVGFRNSNPVFRKYILRFRHLSYTPLPPTHTSISVNL